MTTFGNWLITFGLSICNCLTTAFVYLRQSDVPDPKRHFANSRHAVRRQPLGICRQDGVA